jgi:hypothetical protein
VLWSERVTGRGGWEQAGCCAGHQLKWASSGGRDGAAVEDASRVITTFEDAVNGANIDPALPFTAARGGVAWKKLMPTPLQMGHLEVSSWLEHCAHTDSVRRQDVTRFQGTGHANEEERARGRRSPRDRAAMMKWALGRGGSGDDEVAKGRIHSPCEPKSKGKGSAQKGVEARTVIVVVGWWW